jgi:hypothetical protein
MPPIYMSLPFSAPSRRNLFGSLPTSTAIRQIGVKRKAGKTRGGRRQSPYRFLSPLAKASSPIKTLLVHPFCSLTLKTAQIREDFLTANGHAWIALTRVHSRLFAVYLIVFACGYPAANRSSEL